MENELIQLGGVRKRPEEKARLDLDAVRKRLHTGNGSQMWRSLEELAGSREFEKYVEEEFPERTGLLQVDRRDFLKLAGASLALAGVAGCVRQPDEHIIPYVKQPEQLTPGIPLQFATAEVFGGYGRGVLAESHEGRPTKIEGNPDHPASLGKTDIWMQASILTLYDPDRSQAMRSLGEIATWESFTREMATVMRQLRTTGGAGLRILTETVTSPTFAAQMRTLLARYPQARWYQHEAAGTNNAREGARLATGENVQTIYRFDRAERILSLDSDFLLRMPGSVRYARDYSQRKRVRLGRSRMNRMYVVESSVTITGAKADHRLPVKPSEVEAVARAVAARLGVAGVTGEPPASVPGPWLDALARDLQANRGASIVIAGEEQTPAVHALALAMNEALGNLGRTVLHIDPVVANPTTGDNDLALLTEELQRGAVQALVIIGANPVYTAPADLKFADALTAQENGRDKVPLRIHMGLYENETALLCHWHIPESHYLESWSDVRAFEGTATIIQPLIAPLYESRTPAELVSVLLGQATSAYDIVRGFYQRQLKLSEAAFEKWWQRTLNEGIVRGTTARPRPVTLVPNLAAALPAPTGGAGAESLEIVFRPDPTIWDGRYANNAWLQELPKQISKLVWDNAALMSLETARRLGLSSEDQVELRRAGNTVYAAAWIVPGHPDNVITANLGYGRMLGGSLGTGLGFNAYALRTTDAPWFALDVQVERTGGTYKLATTEFHNVIHSKTIKGDADEGMTSAVQDGHIDTTYDRDEIVVHSNIDVFPAKFLREPDVSQGGEPVTPAETQPAQGHGPSVPGLSGPHQEDSEHPSLYPEYDYTGFAQWGMSVDLNTCIGCSACTIACQAENNIPTVGKQQVMMGREMHWIRIDRYYKGDVDNPGTYFQPMLCVHCEKAPCEPVCPVAATVHSHEGLNQMIYNRCIGTRYCSNNCPYKVRRFNFFKYAAKYDDLPVFKMLMNPDVTVRGRGVMEKCTYCVQRINNARIMAKKQDRPIRDGEVVTACQEACPTQAIIFGDIADKTSLVFKTKQEPHNYGVLEELGTQPRTTYMASFRNPNPEIETERNA